MEREELYVAGIGVSRSIFAEIATEAAEKVEGVARVGTGDIASSLINVFTRTTEQTAPSVETEVIDDKVVITLHISAFFGYTFTTLAAEIREAVARAISVQIGAEVGAVNICIDELVFPKE